MALAALTGSRAVWLVVALVIAALLFLGLRLWAARAPRPADLGLHAGRLRPLPDKPNAVSTEPADSADPRAMAPLPYPPRVDREAARAALLDVLRTMPRTTIVTDDFAAGYLHAEARTALVGYIDDVEFRFDDDARVIHFRSASRLGHSDLGANRKRMQRVEELWSTRP